MPEFPAGIFLTTRPDLGDVSQGLVVTLDNCFGLFIGLLNPKQLEGLRLLVRPFPQQQFNATDGRRSVRPSRGVACLDCYIDSHANRATHLAVGARPQEYRHRIDTASLRGVNVQRWFGSQRALRSVEDFTEFEQRTVYFDGVPVVATKKGGNVLDRGSPSLCHGGDAGDPHLSTSAKVGRLGETLSEEEQCGRVTRAGGMLWQGAVCVFSYATLLHR